MTRRDWMIGALGVTALFVLVLWGRSVGAGEARDNASAVALAESKTIEHALRDSLVNARDSIRVTSARVDTLWRIRTVTVARADTIRLKADSLAIVASLTPGDTASVCRPIQLAYAARTSECELRRVALVEDSAALQVARNGLESSGKALSSALGQVADLSARLGAVSRPYSCRILWLVPCPSRGLSAVLGGLAGGVLVWKVQH